MRPLPPIPPGWRLLGELEPLSAGDKFFNTNEAATLDGWSIDPGLAKSNYIGDPAGSLGRQFKWITNSTPPDKEWLNPWDSA